jgi:L-amino acid N-acyltransferase YncA
MSISGSALAPVAVRDCSEADIPTVAAIYAHYVKTSLATFDENAPTVAEMAQRRVDVLAGGMCFLVATGARDAILGFAYAAPFRPRPAYRFTVEDSVYVAPEVTRRGVGRALMSGLVERCAAAGFRQMVAVIGDSANAASIGLHAASGFERIGTMPAVGFKLGRWIDGVLMQRPLGSGADTPPL